MAIDPSVLISTLLQRMSGGQAPDAMAPPAPPPAAPPSAAPYYLSAPNAPLSYMMPGSPLNAPDPNAEAAARVSALINGMESQPMPAPPRHRGPGNKILGILGDALTNYGSVRAGGPVRPVGPYTEGVQGERLRFESASDEATKNNAAIRNQMRLASYQKEQDRITAKEVAGIRASGFNRSMRTANENASLDINGVPTAVTFIRDPFSGDTKDIQIGGRSVLQDDDIMTQIERGIKGFAPTYLTGLTGPPGKQTAGTFRVDRSTGHIRSIGITPLPVEGFVKDVAASEGALGGMPGVIQAYNEATDETAANAATWTPEFVNKVKNYANATVANTDMKDLFSTPKMINYYDQARGILTPYIRAVSGLTVPEAEYKRYERRLPIPGVTSPENVIGRWNSLVREMLRDMEAKYRVSGRTPPTSLTTVLQQIEQQLPEDKMLGADGGAAPGDDDEAKFFADLDARRKANANAAPR